MLIKLNNLVIRQLRSTKTYEIDYASHNSNILRQIR